MSWLQFDQQNGIETDAIVDAPNSTALTAAVASLTGRLASVLVPLLPQSDTAAASASAASASAATAAASPALWALRLLWLAVLYLCYRRWLNGRGAYTDRSRRLAGRCCVVTGANSGIGLQTARELAARGARVVLACRDAARAERARVWLVRETGNRDVRVAMLDLADLRSVRRFAGEFLRDSEWHGFITSPSYF